MRVLNETEQQKKGFALYLLDRVPTLKRVNISYRPGSYRVEVEPDAGERIVGDTSNPKTSCTEGDIYIAISDDSEVQLFRSN